MCCEYIRPLFSDPKREEFYMIAMNDDYVPLKEIYIASGIPNRVQFDTHKLLRDAVASQCTCVVLAHNHPSGLAAASNAVIVGFQVRPSASARKLAEKEEIEIRLCWIMSF